MILTSILLIAGLPDLLADVQVTIHERIIIRVPRLPVRQAQVVAVPAPLRWVEKKAPKCIDATLLRGAAVTRPDSVDLVLQGGKRVRAKLDADCPALDFYSGFYLKPKDGKVCAGRDEVRSRAGGQCRIKAFKTLIPSN